MTNQKPESKNDSKTKIYWAKQKNCQLANYVPEKQEGGKITQVEKSLSFTNRTLVCDTSTADGKKMSKFVESHKAFLTGQIVLCETMEEASARSRVVEMQKANSKVDPEEIDFEKMPMPEGIGTGNM